MVIEGLGAAESLLAFDRQDAQLPELFQPGQRRGGDPPEQRADALTGYPVRRQSIQSFYTAGHC